jgi:hypothetical protein
VVGAFLIKCSAAAAAAAAAADAAAAAAAAATGGNFSLFPSATAKNFGTEHAGPNYGLIFTSTVSDIDTIIDYQGTTIVLSSLP